MAGVNGYKATLRARVALPEFNQDRIQRRCSSCGLQWEAVHEAEVCPLLELEMGFFSVDWLMMSGE